MRAGSAASPCAGRGSIPRSPGLAALVGLSAGLAAACGSQAGTGIIVEVEATPLVQARIDTIRIQVWNGTPGQPIVEETFPIREGPLPRLPARLGLRPADPGRTPTLHIEATGLGGPDHEKRATAETTVTFRPSEVMRVLLTLGAYCPGGCAPEQICVPSGVCAPVSGGPPAPDGGATTEVDAGAPAGPDGGAGDARPDGAPATDAAVRVDGGCAGATAGTPCGLAACAVNLYTPAATCNGAGVCQEPAPQVTCDRYRCTLNGCLLSCDGHDDCTDDSQCERGRCVPRKPGGPCRDDRECLLGLLCVAGLCV